MSPLDATIVEPEAITYPYPGLRPYTSQEAEIFFGREEHVDDLLCRLQKMRFIGVTGPSGCGKSSLIRAGVIPALLAGLAAKAGSDWQVATMRPGAEPFKNLRDALRDSTGPHNAFASEDGFLQTVLRSGPQGLVEALAEYTFPKDSNLLLLVDQFEELFRVVRQDDCSEAGAFVELLLASARTKRFRIFVMLTMRSDFLGNCPIFRGLPEALNDSQYLTPRLTRDQQLAAIDRPASMFNATVRADVANRILNEMGSDPDQLPLMQHLLMRMWREEHSKAGNAQGQIEITLQTYGYVGGLRGCLSAHANRIFERFTAAEQRMAELLLRQLAEVSSESRTVRRPRRFDDLCRLLAPRADSAQRSDLVGVINAFRREGRCFLMPPAHEELSDDSIIDISHESLIRQWTKLKKWVEDEVKITRVRRLVTEKTQQWKANPNDEAYLLYGVELAQAQDWRKNYPAQLDCDEQTLLDESTKREEDAVRQKEAGKFTAQLEKMNRWLKVLVGVSITLGILAAILGIWAALNAIKARKNSEMHEGQAWSLMSIEAGTHIMENPDLQEEDVSGSVVWYANALTVLETIKPLLGAERSELLEKHIRFRLGAAWRQLPRLDQLLYHDGLQAVDFSPDGKWAVTGSAKNNDARLWDLDGRTFKTLDVGEPVNDVCFSLCGEYVLTASGDPNDKNARGHITIWKVSSRQRVGTPFELDSAATRVAYSKNEKRLLAVSGNLKKKVGAVSVWDCADGLPINQPMKLPGAGKFVNWAEFNADGSEVVIAAEDKSKNTGSVLLWKPDSKEKPQEKPENLEPTIEPVNFACFGPGGEISGAGLSTEIRIVSCSGMEGETHGQATFWRSLNQNSLGWGQSLDHLGSVQRAAFSPNGDMFATASFDGKARLWKWDPGTNRVIRTGELPHGGFVYWADFSPDGRYLCTSCRDRKVRVWDVLTSKQVIPPLLVGSGTSEKVQILKDGVTLAAMSSDAGTVRMWKLLADDSRTTTLKSPGSVTCAAVTTVADNVAGATNSSVKPANFRVAVATNSSTKPAKSEVRIWDPVKSVQSLQSLNQEGVIKFVALNKDGQRLVILDDANTVGLWNASPNSPKPEILRIGNSNASASFAAFDNDGDQLITVTGDAKPTDGEADLWNARTNKLLYQLKGGHKEQVTFAAFNPDGSRVVTTNGKHGLTFGEATVWNTKTGERVFQLGAIDDDDAKHTEAVFHAVFSHDGDFLLTSSADNTARLWDAQTGRALRANGKPVVLKHTADVIQAAFSPDDRYVATASMDGTSSLWDMRSGDRILTFDHSSSVKSVSFSPSGTFVLTVCRDGAVRLWDVRMAKMQADGGRPQPLISILKNSKEFEIFFAQMERVAEDKGVLSAFGYSPRLGGGKNVLVKQWSFSRDDRPLEQIAAEAHLLAHREINPVSRSMTLLDDNKVSEIWEERKQAYLQSFQTKGIQDAHIQEVDKSEASAQFEAALWHLDRLIELEQDKPDFLVRRAECFKRIADEIAKRDPNSPLRTKHLNSAEKDLTAAFKISDDPAHLAARARIRTELGQYEQALLDYAQIDSLGKLSRHWIIEKAKVHEKKGHLNRAAPGLVKLSSDLVEAELTNAIKEYVKVEDSDRKVDFKDFQLLRDLTDLYFLTRQYPKVIETSSEAIQSSPSDPRVPALYQMRGRARAAIPAQALKAVEDFEAAATGFVRISSPQDAIAAYGDALMVNELDSAKRALLCIEKGKLHRRLSQFEGAREDLRRALVANPKEWRAYEEMGLLDLTLRHWKEAAVAFEKAVGINPPEESLVGLLQSEAQARMNGSEWEKAVEVYSSILKHQKQKDVIVLEGRGRAFTNLSKWAEAASDFEEAFGLLPPNSWQLTSTLQGLTRAYRNTTPSRLELALQAYDKALAQLPSNSQLLVQLSQDKAKILGSQGFWDKAAEVYQKAIDIQPADSPLLNNLLQEQAKVLANSGHYDTALEMYQKRVEQLTPNNNWQLRTLLQDQAMAYGYSGRWDHALTAYDKALQPIQTNNPQYVFLLQDKAWVCGLAGRWSEAAELYQRAIDLQSNNSVLYRLLAQAQAEQGQGQWDAARATLEQARGRFSTDPWFEFHLARIHLMGGDKATYRRLRDELVKRFGQTVGASNSIAWALVLEPCSKDEAAQAITFARKAVEIEADKFNSTNTLGAAYFRAGEFDKAIESLNEAAELFVESEASKLRPVNKEGRADDLLLLAMAHFGRSQEKNNKKPEADMAKAKQALAAAVKCIDQRTSLNEPNLTIWVQEDRKLLRREAEEMIKP